ncbi:recombinase family protein [Streptomyces sp. BPTC-684]|uniref:recombinase family protein n=1 Tax=Streptomyces sp. BPTC-684 TaxID=3043734 RepID=UPI0024B26AF7|nr:recombinase family protein [Streptomyces sp. BPTC-684]WHM37470.1 recombinase family protein [Streptomyces sp. BPTC-684]
MTTTTANAASSADLTERHGCPKCAAPAGSPCRTGSGKVATSYHTARFGLVPSLKAELTVKTPADRSPGKAWTAVGAPVVAPEATPGAPIRIGYARCSTAAQELQSQLDMLARAECTKVFSEKISTRVKTRPEFEAALTLARDIKAASPHQPVILTVVEMKRLARGAVELMTLGATLQTDDIQLEILSGPLQGIHDPHGAGAIVFAVMAVGAEVEREGIREKTLEGLETAASNGRHGGRPPVMNTAKLAAAQALQAEGMSVTAIAKELKVSRATMYRALGDAE